MSTTTDWIRVYPALCVYHLRLGEMPSWIPRRSRAESFCLLPARPSVLNHRLLACTKANLLDTLRLNRRHWSRLIIKDAPLPGNAKMNSTISNLATRKLDSIQVAMACVMTLTMAPSSAAGQSEPTQEKFRSPALTAAANNPELDKESYSAGKFIFTQMTDLWGHDRFKSSPHFLPSICLQEMQMMKLLVEFQSVSQKNIETELSKKGALWSAMHAARHRLIDSARHHTQEAADEAARKNTSEARLAYHAARKAFEESEGGRELMQNFARARNTFDLSPAGADYILVRSLKPALLLARRNHSERCTEPLKKVNDQDYASAQKSLAGIKNELDFAIGWMAGLASSGLVYRQSIQTIRDEDEEMLAVKMQPSPVFSNYREKDKD